MTGRQTRGRQRIPISRIQNQDDLYATFSKRRSGLYKKASELSTLCGVDTGIIVFSPTNIPYSFFSPNMDSVVERYINPNQPRDAYSRAVETTTRSRIEALNKSLDEILDEKEQLKEKSKYLEEIDRTRQKGRWEETPIDSLNREQVKEQMAWFQAFKAQVDSRIEDLENGASTSAPNPQNLLDVAGPSTGVGPSIFAPGPSFTSGSNHASGHHNPSYFSSQDPSAAGGSNDITDMHFPASLSHDPFFGDRSEFAFGSQDLPGGGCNFTSDQLLLPPPPLNPSTSGRSTDPHQGQGGN